MTQTELKDFLEEKAAKRENIAFIESDPIQIPHQFSKKEDIEIAGFLTATIAWGNRTMIIKNAKKMMCLMDEAPYDFIRHHTSRDLDSFNGFVHRTFNAEDLKFFITALKHIYTQHNGLERVLNITDNTTSYRTAISNFKTTFFNSPHLPRTEKHISNPLKNSAAKRINMFLRWMVL